jgi:hypothetical protein
MKPHQNAEPTAWQLHWDVASTRALLWLVHPSVLNVLRPDVHLFLANRYGRLARYHRRLGHKRRAQELDLKAIEHFRLGGGYEPPPAFAMAMGRPRPFDIVDAVARMNRRSPNDIA